MKRIILSILLFLILQENNVLPQSINTAQSRFAEFIKSHDSNGETQDNYNTLYLVYKEYTDILKNNPSYSLHKQAVAGLREIHPHLIDGAFYFTGKNNQSKTLMFAEAYLDISLLEEMKDSNLPLSPDYPTIAYFAASKNYNTQNYAKAVKYLDAYIKSGDTKNAKTAFNFLAKSYIHLNLYESAKQVLENGLNRYPEDLAMLTTIINMLSESKSDDTALQKYVDQASKYKPKDEGLLNIQTQLYERIQNFEYAATIYEVLRTIKPNNLELAKRHAICCYNAGVKAYNEKIKNTSETLKNPKTYSDAEHPEYKLYFFKAAEILNEVLSNDPLSINYAYALANAYSILGYTQELKKINKKIASLGQQPVKSNINPSYISVNQQNIIQNPHTSPSLTLSESNLNSNKIPITASTNDSPVTNISDVDRDIPITEQKNDDTFVVIIANSRYDKVANVDNAENDGKIFAEYCNKVLGIPELHIRSHYNTTYGDLLDAIEDIKSIANAKHGRLNIIFYYAGHGIPNEETKSGYILPVDADGKQMRVCYPLNELYTELGNLQADNTVVFLDACFSGTTRSGNEMLISARSVAIDVDTEEIEGKVVVFSAAAGNQTALGYTEQNHGMFTYFLLKKLKETEGSVDLGTLADYLSENVALESQLKNRKRQTPSVFTGNGYDTASWKKLTLK